MDLFVCYKTDTQAHRMFQRTEKNKYGLWHNESPCLNINIQNREHGPGKLNEAKHSKTE